MKVIILAGGKSKRVKPIEEKCCVRICGKMLIEWQIEFLRNAGFRGFVLVGNPENVERLRQLNVGTVVVQEEKDGMIWGMMAAKEEVQGEDAVLVVSSNDVVEEKLWIDIGKKVEELKNVDGFLVGYKVYRYFPGGYLKHSEQGHVSSIIEKPGEGKEPSDLVNLVIHLHRDVKALYQAFETVKSQTQTRDDLYERALQLLFDQGKKYLVHPYDGFWQAVKYPWHFLRVSEFFLKRCKRFISSSASVASTAVLNGEVVIEDEVKVFDHAVINGPVFIGKGSVIGNHALIRESSLGQRCVVGHSTEVARSLLQEDVWMHKNYIGDSVIGSNVAFGSGAMTGNLRLDEGEISVLIQGEKVNSRRTKLGLITGDDIRVGINTSCMPGIKIGSQSMVGAGLTIDQDIPEKTYVKKGPKGLEMRENVKAITTRSS